MIIKATNHTFIIFHPPVQMTESACGRKITLVTSSKEVRDVIHNVVKVANVNADQVLRNGRSRSRSRSPRVDVKRKISGAKKVAKQVDKTLQVSRLVSWYTRG